MAQRLGEHRGVDVRRTDRGDSGPGPGRGLGNVPPAAPSQPMPACRPLSVPRARRHRHDTFGGNRERGADASAAPGVGKPLRAFCGIRAQQDPLSAGVQGDDASQQPPARGHAAADSDQEPGTCGHKSRGYRVDGYRVIHRPPAARGFPMVGDCPSGGIRANA